MYPPWERVKPLRLGDVSRQSVPCKTADRRHVFDSVYASAQRQVKQIVNVARTLSTAGVIMPG